MCNHRLNPRNLLFATLLIGCFSLLPYALQAQTPAPNATQAADEAALKKIYATALTDGRCYQWLEHLCLRIGHRLSGSAGADKAVVWGKSMLDSLKLDSVWLQPVMVPRWVRGAREQLWINGSRKAGGISMPALALGGSVGTTEDGISGKIVEVKSWAALDSLGLAGQIHGKVVFYNRPMNPTYIRTFDAYRDAVDQRSSGASRAAKHGAVGVLVRSMSLKIDGFPHTGGLRYDSTYKLIPAVAISTADAERLSAMLREESNLVAAMILGCHTLSDTLSYNVIGEIRGREKPKEIIAVGGHLDSWDVGHGAHDDGAGCVQSMDVLRYLRKIGYRPRKTIRCVLFMNEENGLRGGRKYAAEAQRKGEFHRCAIESDAGGFTPRGFTFEAEESVFPKMFEKVKALQPLLEPYGLTIGKGGSGADIGPLKSQKGLLCGYVPDPQRYFDVHHAASDVFSAINQRELELGAAAMTALIYLIDKHVD